MNIEKMAEKLEPWMRVDTWHTTHPKDYERFHLALSAAFSEFGPAISYDDFKNAMEHLAAKLPSAKLAKQYLNEAIERYAANAETISSYLSDIEI
ncbi:hypothetical protein SAMN05216198_0322 [Halopseudomonas litoralis]|uniref:Uncharacterized protein n=1 Tax=Halopseudomonas litoralis TaxID=797277 RepID=A0A1H1LNQ1_9GAMM|nr:hypothetical protein [Halopseudomonas litoralis]SDR75922.1 hypothetical protein SAMN05216198_0322 [Halopseudomonas litoralis]